MAMTIFDLAALGLILGSAIMSAMRGLVGELVSFIGMLAALIIAKIFAVRVADIVFTTMNPREIAVVFAFVLTYIAARIVVAIVHEILNLVVKTAHLSRINRFFGALLGAIKGVLIVSICVLACSFSRLPATAEWQNAVTAPFFERIAMAGKSYLPAFLSDQIQFHHKAQPPEGLSPEEKSALPPSAKPKSLKQKTE